MILIEKQINQKRFLVTRNSIIDENVDAIANPANEHLSHGGGVAGIKEITGKFFERLKRG